MKKYLLAIAAIAMLAMTSCKNNQKSEAEEDVLDPLSETEALINDEAVKAEFATLIESSKKLKPVPFLKAQKDGKLVLTDKEKMVKPDYLLNPSVTNELATLDLKYRAVGMLTADKIIANMYELPVAEYDEAILKLLTDINDPALMNFFTLPMEDIEQNREAYEIFVDQEYEEGRAPLFWNGCAAAMVEQLYILTRDVDKFMPMFTDELAADITFNFICLHDGLTKMVEYYPEMHSFNEVLSPLYVINAISVEQLREQLIQVKEEVETARAFLLQ